MLSVVCFQAESNRYFFVTEIRQFQTKMSGVRTMVGPSQRATWPRGESTKGVTCWTNTAVTVAMVPPSILAK